MQPRTYEKFFVYQITASELASALVIDPKIMHVNKRDFFQLSLLGRDQ